jgi:hypothetical protein
VGLFAAVIVLSAGLVAGCHGSSRHNAEPPIPGTVPSTPEDKAIAAVLSSPPRQGFGFFPNHPGRQPCAIPGGDPGRRRSVKAICATRVSGRPGYSGQTLVVFAETWPWRAFHYAGKPPRPQTHSWRFVISPSGRVARRVEQSGDFSPQLVKWPIAIALPEATDGLVSDAALAV